jgi:hypothetical protein
MVLDSLRVKQVTIDKGMESTFSNDLFMDRNMLEISFQLLHLLVIQLGVSVGGKSKGNQFIEFIANIVGRYFL